MRAEILVGPAERRRRWSVAEKLRIMREAFAPGRVYPVSLIDLTARDVAAPMKGGGKMPLSRREHRVLWKLLLFLMMVFSSLFAPTVVRAQTGVDQDVSAIVDAVARMCALPAEKGYEVEHGGSAEAGVILRLTGVKGEGRLSKTEWEGIHDVLATDRASDRVSARDCTQNLLPIILKAFDVQAESQALLRGQYRMQNNFTAHDPVLRAVAFREAFRSHGTFFVDLAPEKEYDSKSAYEEASNERKIVNSIGYYDLETGIFASRGPPPRGSLSGQLSGDTITFQVASCSGRLVNNNATWTFTGPVVCQNGRYVGEFQMR